MEICFTFDHSKNHDKRPSDALNVIEMNLKHAGKQPIMRDGWFINANSQRVIQKMHYELNGVKIAKGLRAVLIRRGIEMQSGWKRDDLRRVLSQQPDFMEQKCMLQEYIEACGHKCFFLPKFHCELNTMEMIWGVGKRRFKDNDAFNSRTHVTRLKTAFESMTTDVIRKIFVKIRRYETCYRGVATTTTIEKAVNKMKKCLSTTSRKIHAPIALINDGR